MRLVLPRRAALRDGLDFAAVKTTWILDQIDALPAPVPFAPGAVIPVLGRDHVIRHRPKARRGVWRKDGVIWTSGRAEHLSRRIRDFLQAEVRHELSNRAQGKAAKIDRKVRRVRIGDMSSRWGSCGPDGSLKFSWRLVFAPEAVLDYVVAHEVAHLKIMNHGAGFWALTAQLTADVAGARRWLREQGNVVLRYG